MNMTHDDDDNYDDDDDDDKNEEEVGGLPLLLMVKMKQHETIRIGELIEGGPKKKLVKSKNIVRFYGWNSFHVSCQQSILIF